MPQYERFDRAHREEHVREVIRGSLELAAYYPEVDVDVLYAAAACHDIGLCEGRAEHHLVSGRMVRSDSGLRAFFNELAIETIAEACEDHRASASNEPRSIYGRIVAEADRSIESLSIVRRTVEYGLDNYGHLDREGHWQRCVGHLEEKYGEGGYMKLWIPQSRNAAELQRLRALIKDRQRLRELFDQLYNELAEKRNPAL